MTEQGHRRAKPGFCAHVSNGRRADTIKLLREHADRLETKLESTKGDA